MKHTLPIIGVILLLVAYAAFSPNNGSQNAPKLGTINIAITNPMTQGSALCSASASTLLVGTSTSGRSFMTISNDSPVSVFLGFGNKASLDKGMLLAASSTYTLDATHSFTGAIYCIASGAAATTTYSDSSF